MFSAKPWQKKKKTVINKIRNSNNKKIFFWPLKSMQLNQIGQIRARPRRKTIKIKIV